MVLPLLCRLCLVLLRRRSLLLLLLLGGRGTTGSLGVLAAVDGLGAHVVLAVGALVRLRLDDLDPSAIGDVGDALVAVCAKVRHVLAHASQAGDAGGADADAADENTEKTIFRKESSYRVPWFEC
ncbi:hypothetical protein PspLS_07618 [Pyricularia sp. CBS 133598]|nr:hypothetical protein PspLS_07618 [Pyricularia sp. CBS 133598]